MLPLEVVAIDHGESLVQRFREAKGRGDPRKRAVEFRHQVLMSLARSSVGIVCGSDLLDSVVRHGLGHRAIFGLPDLDAASVTASRDWLVTGADVATGRVAGVKLSLVFGEDPLREVGHVVDTVRWLTPLYESRGLGLVLEASFTNPPRDSLVYEGIAASLSDAKPTLIKSPYPEVGEEHVESACQRITEACGSIPWVLLSGGCDFPTFRRRLDRAVVAGCRGYIAGSALWKDAISQADAVDWMERNLDDRVSELASSRTEGESLGDVAAA